MPELGFCHCGNSKYMVVDLGNWMIVVSGIGQTLQVPRNDLGNRYIHSQSSHFNFSSVEVGRVISIGAERKNWLRCNQDDQGSDNSATLATCYSIRNIPSITLTARPVSRTVLP
jgi:hypothetical protein